MIPSVEKKIKIKNEKKRFRLQAGVKIIKSDKAQFSSSGRDMEELRHFFFIV